MRELELILRDKWAERLIRNLLPHIEAYPRLTARSSQPDPLKAYIVSLGAASWGAIRRHCLTLERACKKVVGFLPWDTYKLLELFAKLKRDEAAASGA